MIMNIVESIMSMLVTGSTILYKGMKASSILEQDHLAMSQEHMLHLASRVSPSFIPSREAPRLTIIHLLPFHHDSKLQPLNDQVQEYIFKVLGPMTRRTDESLSMVRTWGSFLHIHQIGNKLPCFGELEILQMGTIQSP